MSIPRLKPTRGPLLFALMLVLLLLAPRYSSGTVSEANFTDVLGNLADNGPIAIASSTIKTFSNSSSLGGRMLARLLTHCAKRCHPSACNWTLG